MMKEFLEPKLEILLFNVEDIITTSNEVPNDPDDPINTPLVPM